MWRISDVKSQRSSHIFRLELSILAAEARFRKGARGNENHLCHSWLSFPPFWSDLVLSLVSPPAFLLCIFAALTTAFHWPPHSASSCWCLVWGGHMFCPCALLKDFLFYFVFEADWTGLNVGGLRFRPRWSRLLPWAVVILFVLVVFLSCSCLQINTRCVALKKMSLSGSEYLEYNKLKVKNVFMVFFRSGFMITAFWFLGFWVKRKN